MAVPDAVRAQIARLYIATGSVKFGQFRLSVHNDKPNLPLSPYYLHYPKEDEPGSELMPQLEDAVGEAFFHILQDHPSLPDVTRRFAGVPKGALGLGRALARRYPGYPGNLVEFSKIQHDDGRTIFVPPGSGFNNGDDLIIVEDHTSGGRNKKLIRAAALEAGFVVNTMLTVVDRMQGGVAAMAELGVQLHAIFTTEELLSVLVALGEISQEQMDQVMEYIATNPL